MNIKRAKQEITDTIEAYLMQDEDGEYVIPAVRQRPILLLGAPGIGKTQIMEQIAKECSLALVAYTITHHTRQSAIGLPFISKKKFGDQEYQVTEYTMSEIIASMYQRMEETGLSRGILFLDEINCVSETLAPAMLQFLQYKTFGSHSIPKGWVIVAAGNPPEYNKSVREFDVVTMDRVKRIDVEPDFAVWKEYALKQQLHPAVLSYLTTHPGSFYRMETTVDGRSFATPRSWEDLSGLLQVYEKLNKPVDKEVIVQYIQHDRTARDFANYLELYSKYRMDGELEAVLDGKISDDLLRKASRASFDERLNIVGILHARLSGCFMDALRSLEVLDLIYPVLLKLKEGLTGGGSQDAGTLMEETLADFQEEAVRLRKADLLDRQKRKLYRKAADLLQEGRSEAVRVPDGDGGKIFLAWKTWVDRCQDEAEEKNRTALERLEYAFDFLEAAYGGGQEMVLFVTNLNTDPHSIRFLQENACERYFRYNRELLFDEKTQEIEMRLKELQV